MQTKGRFRSALAALACLAAAFSVRADFEVYFMRHSETPWNRAKVLQGSIAFVDVTPMPVDQTTVTTIAELKRRNVWTSLWFVQDAKKAEKYRDSGCDAFVTDHVTRVRKTSLH